MSAPAQILANRANAQHSTGPRTTSGKAAASRNAETHGLTSRKLVLTSEEQTAFDALRAELYETHQMTTAEERALVDRYVEARCRLERCRCIETALMEQTIEDVQAEDPAIHPDRALVALFTDQQHARRLRLFLRYQAPVEREYYKADTALSDYLRSRERARLCAEAVAAQAEAVCRARVAKPDSNATPAAENGFVLYPHQMPLATVVAETATGVSRNPPSDACS